MKFTNSKALAALNTLGRLQESSKLGYVIAKNRRKISNEIQEYIQIHDDITRQFGEVNDRGELVIPFEKWDDYCKALDEYDMECDIDVITVDEELFTSGHLTSQDMFALDWMVQD